MKLGTKKKPGGYARYIATHEGVEKLDDSIKKIPATDKQKQLIQKLLLDFSDSMNSARCIFTATGWRKISKRLLNV